MKKFNFIFLLVVILSTFFKVNTNYANECEDLIENKIVNWSILQIKKSEIAQVNNISCDVALQMNEMPRDQDKIFITTGRKRGKPTICLSDDKDYPCKFIIGNINNNKNPTDAIQEIYSYNPPKSSQLNETVERLFLKPSSLIQ